jgi:putative transposase
VAGTSGRQNVLYNIFMARVPRVDIADYPYHVLNRANARAQIFNTNEDYRLFMEILTDTLEFLDMRLLAFCLMPNHWHLILEPRVDGDLSRFMARLTNTHVKQYQAKHESVGMGHLYQGRYKSFMIEEGQYFYTVLRYVERNALKAKLCQRAEDWPWGSAYLRARGSTKLLSPLPIDLPANYLIDLNASLFAPEEEAVELSENRSVPFASAVWQDNLKVIVEQKTKGKILGL